MCWHSDPSVGGLYCDPSCQTTSIGGPGTPGTVCRGRRSSCTCGIQSHSGSLGLHSTYTGLAELPAPSAAPGSRRGKQRPLAAIWKLRQRLLGQTKTAFSNKNSSSPHHVVLLPPLWQHQFTFIPSAVPLFFLLQFLLSLFWLSCSHFEKVFIHQEYLLTEALVF